MGRMGAENLLAVGAVWLITMLPNAAFGGDPSVTKFEPATTIVASSCPMSVSVRGISAEMKVGV